MAKSDEVKHPETPPQIRGAEPPDRPPDGAGTTPAGNLSGTTPAADVPPTPAAGPATAQDPAQDPARIPPPDPPKPQPRQPGRPSKADKAARAEQHRQYQEALRARRAAIKAGERVPDPPPVGQAPPGGSVLDQVESIAGAGALYDDQAEREFDGDPLKMALSRALAWKRIQRRDEKATLTGVDKLMVRYSYNTALYGWQLVRQVTEAWAGPEAAAAFVPDDLAFAWTAPLYKAMRRSSLAGWIDEAAAGLVTVASIARAVLAKPEPDPERVRRVA